MKQDDIPTQFLGGRKALFERIASNGHLKTIVKGGIAAVLLFVSVLVTVTRDWSFLLRDTGKEMGEASAEVRAMRREVDEVKRDYARKDVLEPRLSAIEAGVKDLREQSAENERLLRQILIEQRRK